MRSTCARYRIITLSTKSCDCQTALLLAAQKEQCTKVLLGAACSNCATAGKCLIRSSSLACVVQVGAKWLSEWCHRSGGSSDDALALAVTRILLVSKSADEAAAELFDLLGDGSFDAIQQLLEHR